MRKILDHFRSDHFTPALMERRSREAWEKDGFKDIASRARERAKSILKEHVPEPMERDLTAALDGFMKETARAHGHRA